jgi:regulator of protease activity HflC (stomatin/prohibitin superfamily)
MKSLRLFTMIIGMECDEGKMLTDREMEDLVTAQLSGILDERTNLVNVGVSVKDVNF